jgi:hypothetical protein
MMKQTQAATPGLESFWETCDQDGVGDHPLMRELCYRLDAMQRYRTMIADAEANGQDEALELLSRNYDQQQTIVQRIRDELARTDITEASIDN